MNEYEILREIGQGTTARVVEAKTEDARIVALKIFSSRDEGIQWCGREEASRMRALSHPNILKIERFQESNPTMLVMEFIEGCSLQDRVLQKGTLYSRDGLVLLQKLAEAMAHAHEKGIFHGAKGGEVHQAARPRPPILPQQTRNSP